MGVGFVTVTLVSGVDLPPTVARPRCAGPRPTAPPMGVVGTPCFFTGVFGVGFAFVTTVFATGFFTAAFAPAFAGVTGFTIFFAGGVFLTTTGFLAGVGFFTATRGVGFVAVFLGADFATDFTAGFDVDFVAFRPADLFQPMRFNFPTTAFLVMPIFLPISDADRPRACNSFSLAITVLVQPTD